MFCEGAGCYEEDDVREKGFFISIFMNEIEFLAFSCSNGIHCNVKGHESFCFIKKEFPIKKSISG